MKTCKVLLIEDDEIVAGLVRFLVERQGHRMEWLSHGANALDQVLTMQPDALILDILLPYVDGFSLLSELRGHADTARLPILMLTGKTRESDIVKALDMGANDYLSKPFQPAELTARLNRLLSA